MLTSVFADLRYAARMLANSPGFAAVAILTLALGIGANTAIFSFINATLLETPAFPEPDRLVNLWERSPNGGRAGISTFDFLDWRSQNTVFEGLTMTGTTQTTWSGEGDPIRLGANFVSPNYFDIFGVKPFMGRSFEPADHPSGDTIAENGAGTGERVIISYKAWQQRFGGDKNIIGRKLILHSAPRTVIGVLPPNSPFDYGFAEVWFPYVFEPKDMSRDYRWLAVQGRLKKGVTLDQARAEMNVIAARLEKQYPESNKRWGVTVDRYLDQLANPELKQSLYVLMAAVVAVLLIACANLANLTLARAAAREKEIAIRASLGASQWRLARQCLTENLLLSLIGGSLGLAAGYAMVGALKALLPPYMLPGGADVTIDLRVLAFTLAIAVLTGVFFGLAPAWRAARPNLTSSMKEGGSATASSASQRLRGALVALEIALAFILLTGAGLLIRSFDRLNRANTGVDGTNVLTMNVPFMMSKFKDGSGAVSYARRMLDGIGSLPGVRGVAVTTALPLEGANFTPFQIAGQPPKDRTNRDACFFKAVSENYFETVRLPLKSGRGIAASDVKGAPAVAVMNETMARTFFANQDPIGQRILVPEVLYAKRQVGAEIPWEVIGVVADEIIRMGADPRPVLYVPFAQQPNNFFSLVVKGATNPESMIPAIRHQVKMVDADQVLTNIFTMEELKSEMQGADRLRMTLLGIFAGLALVLAMVGIYGVVSYSVAQRTHEMGLRMALGASRGNILALIIRYGMLLTAIGLAIGLAGAFALARLIRALLYGVSATDPATMGSVAAALAGIALIACYFPAQRATGIDPLVALRQD